MVTGVYLPEINGAVLQCAQLIRGLSSEVDFQVLSGSNEPVLLSTTQSGGLTITRVGGGDSSVVYFLAYMFCLLFAYIRILCSIDIVHFHGFSLRNAALVLIAKLFRKKVVLKMTSFGQDDPASIRDRSKILFTLFRLADAYISIGPAFSYALRVCGIETSKCFEVPNAVDRNLFFPAAPSSKTRLRSALGFLSGEIVLLFVGHFSSDKRPAIAYAAYKALRNKGYNCKLIMIGRTSGGFEIDPAQAKRIIADAELCGIRGHLLMVEKTNSMADYMRASDFFIHPSVREGSPNVVIEAMACALPPIVTNIPGVTDVLIVDRRSGFLMEPDDADALSGILEEGILDQQLCNSIGEEATKFVTLRHDLFVVSRAIKRVYDAVASR